MPNLAFPSVNELECSWADIAITANVNGGQSVDGVDWESIKWSRKVTTAESRGTSGGRVMKRTAGSEDVDAEGTLTRSGVATLAEALEAAAIAAGYQRGNEVPISAVSFDLMVQHTPIGTTRIYQARLVGCRFLGDADDMKQGNDADIITLTLNPIKILTLSSTGNWITLR